MIRAIVAVLALWCDVSGRQLCRAPAGWYVDGVRPDGSYELEPVLGRPEDDIADARSRRQFAGPAPVHGRIWCAPGSDPRLDGTTVRCAIQRLPSRVPIHPAL